VQAARADRRDQAQQGLKQARLAGTVGRVQAVEEILGPQPRGACRTAWGNERTTASMARSWSVAHERVRSGRSSGNGAASPGPSSRVCSSFWRASTAGSAEAQTPSEVSNWRALPGAPLDRRAWTAGAVRSEAWDELSVVSGATALVVARVRGRSAGAARFTRATNSSRSSRTENRQFTLSLLVRGGPRGLPTAGQCGQRNAGEEEHAGQGLSSLLAFRSLRQAGQGPGAGICVASVWNLSSPSSSGPVTWQQPLTARCMPCKTAGSAPEAMGQVGPSQPTDGLSGGDR